MHKWKDWVLLGSEKLCSCTRRGTEHVRTAKRWDKTGPSGGWVSCSQRGHQVWERVQLVYGCLSGGRSLPEPQFPDLQDGDSTNDCHEDC